MSHFILDIETKPDAELIEAFTANIKPAGNIKDPAKIAADIQKKKDAARKSMSVDQDYCDIVCIGIKEVGQPGNLYTIEQMEQWSTENLNDDMKLVTFNGKTFDIPIIIKSGIKKGVRLPYAVLKGMTERYSKASNHVDLIQVLSFGDRDKYKSLDAYLRIYLKIQKETLGDDFFDNATDEELKKHCLEDLQFTEDLFMKFRHLI